MITIPRPVGLLVVLATHLPVTALHTTSTKCGDQCTSTRRFFIWSKRERGSALVYCGKRCFQTCLALRRGKQPSSGLAITTGRESQPPGSLPKAARVTFTLPAVRGLVEYERYHDCSSCVQFLSRRAQRRIGGTPNEPLNKKQTCTLYLPMHRGKTRSHLSTDLKHTRR